jgi:hypothetical protein
MNRIPHHCPSCGTAEKSLGIECSCPCHTWEGRICAWCGGLVELDEYQIGIRLNLKGEQTPHIKVTKGHCRECKRTLK